MTAEEAAARISELDAEAVQLKKCKPMGWLYRPMWEEWWKANRTERAELRALVLGVTRAEEV